MAIMNCFALGSLCDASTCTGPSYSSDVVEAAQAQVLQEQELAVQQAIASNRCAALFFTAIYYLFILASLQHCTACLLLIKRFQDKCISISACLANVLVAVGRKTLVMMLPLHRLLKTQLFSR